jgi:hypothetical protein
MGLEEYTETFREIDEYGLLTDEDREYLIKKGILKSKKEEPDLCCPNCKAPIPRELISRISDHLLEAIYRDREKYAKILFENSSDEYFKETESIMFS